MMRWLVSSSLRGRKAVVLAGAVLLAFGFLQLRHAEFDVLPEFDPPTVEVQTEALGLSAEEVEQLDHDPDGAGPARGVAWPDDIRSAVGPRALVASRSIFEPGTDLYRARQVVQERISAGAGLPNVSRPPPMLQPTSSTSRTVMVGALVGRAHSDPVGVLARWTIAPRLLGVPGVVQRGGVGQRDRQLQVQVDPQKLRDAEGHAAAGDPDHRKRALGRHR